MLAILATIPAIASAQNLPKIDFEALGSVGIAGNFAGLQVWDESYARTYKALNASAEDSSSVWSRNTEGHLEYLGSTNEGGSISALCQSSKDSDAKGLLFLAGNFTSINGTEASHIASYDPTANSFASLGSGLDGPVLALACDDDANTLYAGGTFTGSNDASDSYGGSVASWSYSDQAWSPLPFGGLDGTVFSIEPASPSDNSRSVFFGGNFTLSLSNSNTSSISNSSENYPSLGSALSPIPLGSSSVWAGPGGTGDPNQLFCPQGDGPTGSNWLAPGRDAAIIVVRTDNAHQVGGLRIGNTFKNNRGTSQFK